jgi:hypothetical protein
MSAALRALVGTMHRRMPNRMLHVITPHGRIVAGRKGRKS